MRSEKMAASGDLPKAPLLLLLFTAVVLSLPMAWAQYPAWPQITKDGTAVLLQDYASLPPSSLIKERGFI